MKRVSTFLVTLAFLVFAGTATAQAQSEVMASVGRGVGGGIWRVPDLAGTTQRFDLHATPIWRADFARTYVEGGIGLYLLSHTINNDVTHMSTSFEFGSHIGAGLRIGERRETRIGIALQHLSNAGIKEPNSGVNFILLSASFPL
jgi:lipid A 3-O-deacylase